MIDKPWTPKDEDAEPFVPCANCTRNWPISKVKECGGETLCPFCHLEAIERARGLG